MAEPGLKVPMIQIITNRTQSSSSSLDSKAMSNASSSISLPNTPNYEKSPVMKHTRTRSSTDPNTIPIDLINSFQAHPWFANAEKSFSNDLISVIHIRNYSIGDTIIREGTKAKAMFFIIKGVVEVTSEDDEVVYAELGKGCFFGEIGVLFQVARTTSIVAKTKCIIARITASEFYELYEKHPVVAKAIHDEAITRFTKLKSQKEERGKKFEINLNENELSPLKSVNNAESVLNTSNNIHQLSSLNVQIDGFTSNDSILSEEHKLSNFESGSLYKNNENLDGNNEKIDKQSNYETSDDEKSPKIIIEGNENIPNILDSSIKVIEQNVQNPNLGFIQRYSGRRRASVAVWADDQLSKLQQNIQIQIAAKEKASTSSTSPTSPTSANSLKTSSLLSTTTNKKDTNNLQNNENKKGIISINNQNSTIQCKTTNNKTEKIKKSNNNNNKKSIGSGSIPQSPNKTTNKKTLSSNESDLSIKGSSSIAKNRKKNSCLNAQMYIKKKNELIMKQPYLGPLPISLMKKCIGYLDYKNQFRIRRISKIFNILITHGKTENLSKTNKWKNYKIDESLSTHIDLSTNPKIVKDDVIEIVTDQCGNNVIKILELNRCWGITDRGCKAIERNGSCIKILNLLDCWDVTDNGLISLSSLKQLESIDLSNCRKITNIGVVSILTNCPKLTKISLSYCKNISNEVFNNSYIWRKMKQINLQRCTGIFDSGFAIWKEQITNPSEDTSIPNTFQLQKLNLSDCSFLSDEAICNISQVCPILEEISLSFCCALTEACINNLITNCKKLRVLDLNYCGLAMTDSICKTISEKCRTLESIGFRGCVQVTDEGIKYLINSTTTKNLKRMNCSQCSNISENAKSLILKTGIELLNNQLLITF